MKVRLGALREYLHEHYEFVLTEGRVDDAREKFPDMEDENFEYLVANQPAGSNNKYLMWSCKQADALLQHDPDPQGLRIVIQAVRLFDGNKQRLEKKDLNQYADTSEVEAAVEKLGASKGQQSRQARADTDTIFDDEKFTVLRPHTTEASCKYGVGTKWCIAATATTNYFNSYSSSNNKFYFVIDKTASPNAASSKFAIVILEPINPDDTSRIQVFDATDKQVGLRAVIKHTGAKWPAIWAKIQEHAQANPITREVEDARKSIEEHVKALLKGEKVSNEGLQKIAKDADLNNSIILGLIKRMQEYTGPADYTDPRHSIIARLSDRAAQLPSAGAVALIKFVSGLAGADRSYRSNRYHLESLVKGAPLTPEAFNDLARTGNDDTLSLIIKNPNCPDEIIERAAARLSEIENWELKYDIWRALIKRGTITPEQMRDAMSSDPRGYYYSGLGYEVLNYPSMSANLSPDLLRLVPVKSADDLKKFLALPNVPPDLVADLVSQHWKQLKKPELYELLKTVNLPSEMIERIWADKNQHIRTALLQNPAIGLENAKKFATSRNSAYRFAIAHNPILPSEDLQVLAGDESASTRAAVASNPSTPAETLKVMAQDEATVVRASVASNPKTPMGVLQALKRDGDDFVRKSANKTLKSLETTEAYVALAMGMHGHLIKEELTDDDDMQDIMTPDWRQIPAGVITPQEFLAIVMLQNNGSATHEEVEEAFGSWPGRPRYFRFGRNRRQVEPQDVWKMIRDDEKDSEHQSRSVTAQGKGWFWSPAGINKGSIYRLTPSGAAAAMGALEKVRALYPQHQWTPRPEAPVRRSPPPGQVNVAGSAASGAPAARGPKTTYKIYGRFKGHPVSTRLKGQAYVGPANTRFAPGEQAEISPDAGKLKVKKVGDDHSQTWDPIDG